LSSFIQQFSTLNTSITTADNKHNQLLFTVLLWSADPHFVNTNFFSCSLYNLFFAVSYLMYEICRLTFGVLSEGSKHVTCNIDSSKQNCLNNKFCLVSIENDLGIEHYWYDVKTLCLMLLISEKLLMHCECRYVTITFFCDEVFSNARYFDRLLNVSRITGRFLRTITEANYFSTSVPCC
jgi:hypothetical protein